ncbi:hypothetical protein [cyanobacterium endosymbiont of Epithemia turgida]|uniref:hypothetical protein n=1 Tax=cyanobacterium endosymbiont of Epithemia turgida TaxID=718217 RepID=UPI0004D17A73|nr:hypothetical protein [cyanobacterium endosymbiont of Epithemia turgida]BAP17566.1 hypothetical protein ETSB_0745 [cyanobacterium endosymbiont of Epithemia turgida isolate EtSB Lake Yunoko]
MPNLAIIFFRLSYYCLLVVVAGGVSLLLATVLMYFVDEPKTSEKTSIKVEI